MLNQPLLSALAIACAASAVSAQSQFGLVPFEQTGDLFVTDSGTDSIYRLADINLDGDFDDLGEVTTFYDENIGPQTLGNNNSIAVAGNGAVFVCDTSEDKIFRLVDLNGDGDCHDAGEIVTWFDGDPAVNQSGLLMVSPNGLTVDLLGKVWIAEANNGSGGTDSIILLEDKNADGDANDAGEASVYFLPPVSGASVADSIPNDVFVGADGHIYYIDGSSNGFTNKEVYRLDDIDGNGFINPATEVKSFFRPPAMASTPFFWALTQDGDGYWYMSDTGNDVIWRFRDENGNDEIEAATEAVVWWQSAGSSLIWELGADSKGGIYACESQSPDRVLYLRDDNNDGTVDPVTETREVYSELVSSVNIGNPRGLALDRQPTLSIQPTVSLGGTVNVLHIATQGDLVLFFYSTATSAPTPLMPYGYLELAAAPASGLLFTATADAFGFHTFGITVPNNPSLVGVTLYGQSVVGKLDRFEFTNLSSTTVQ